MSGWEERLAAELDDLEARAEAAFDEERAEELADRVRAEYARVDLAGRLAASLGTPLTLDVVGVGMLGGRLERAGSGWVLMGRDTVEWLVFTPAVGAVLGASERSVPAVARPATARLGPASVLRAWEEEGGGCVVHRRDGARHEGVLRRVGADFVELVTAGPEHDVGPGGVPVLLPWTALAAVRRDVPG
ncbi:hypothetical protein [Nocardioides sp.]|uniref:hypothetical protein n=1 Tax=Nocardioides sp. TaxID=35761 RepID=UPI0035194CF4